MNEKLWTAFYSGKNLASPLAVFHLEGDALEYAALWNEEHEGRPWGSFVYVVEGFEGYWEFTYF